MARPTDNRVDVITAGGETGVYRDASGTWTWEYEREPRDPRRRGAARAAGRRPTCCPARSARRLLSEAEPVELSRIGAERVAGRDALGSALVPPTPASSIARVDVWVDAATGLPLQRAAVRARAPTSPRWTPASSTSNSSRPTRVRDVLHPAGRAPAVRRGDTLRRAAQRRAADLPPSRCRTTLAGLPRRDARGVRPRPSDSTGAESPLLAVVPVPGRLGRRPATARPSRTRAPSGTRSAPGSPPGRWPSCSSAARAGPRTCSPARSPPRRWPRRPASCRAGRPAVTAAPATVIATRGLTKRYGRVRAVDGIDLDVRAGDVYGFLGANGSGKTTTVRMLLGLVLPTSGEVDVLGERMPQAGRQVLPRVGALIEGPALYGHLSGRENLALFDASGPGGVAAHPAAADRRGARAGRAGRGRPPAGPGVLAGHAAAARAGRRAAPPTRSCSCSTNRPTASTRRASPRSGSCCST